jgi:MoaA/NifB/PqqE/SkfB family radical SAM enzyme
MKMAISSPAPEKRAIKRLEFHMSYVCNQDCVFCSESVRMRQYQDHPLSYKEMVETITRKRREGCEHITFVGGEPTVHPAFLKLLRASKKLSYKTLLITNGIKLAQTDFSSEALPLLDEIVFSIHGPNAAIHDDLAKSSGSFEKLMFALNLIEKSKHKPFVLTNTVVTRHNLDFLEETIALLTDKSAVRHCLISNLAPDGNALAHYLDQAVRLRDLGKLAPRLVQIAQSRGKIIRFFGIPLCSLGESWEASNDLYWDSRTNVERATAHGKVGLEDTWNYTPQRMRFFPEICGSCSAREKQCWGVFRIYSKHFGTSELSPLQVAQIAGRFV